MLYDSKKQTTFLLLADQIRLPVLYSAKPKGDSGTVDKVTEGENCHLS